MPKITLIFFAAVVGLAASACDGGRPKHETVSQADVRSSSAGVEDERSFPSNRNISRKVNLEKLNSFARVSKANSWAQRLDGLSVSDRKSLSVFNTRYFGLLEFDSAEEQRQMIELGIPMPEEILKAMGMSDNDLEALSNEGDLKAKMFYADRLALRLNELKSRSDVSDLQAHDQDLLEANMAAATQAADALRATRSPFAAYVSGYQRSVNYGSVEPAIAALFIGRQLGDTRAAKYLPAFRAGADDPDVAVIYSVYENMQFDLEQH